MQSWHPPTYVSWECLRGPLVVCQTRSLLIKPKLLDMFIRLFHRKTRDVFDLPSVQGLGGGSLPTTNCLIVLQSHGTQECKPRSPESCPQWVSRGWQPPNLGPPAIKTKHHMYMEASFQEILVLWSVTEGEHGESTHHPLALEHIPVGPGWGLN